MFDQILELVEDVEAGEESIFQTSQKKRTCYKFILLK